AETIRYNGHNNDSILAYYARPLGPGPHPGVVLIHTIFGLNEWAQDVALKLAHHGYATLLPDMFYRYGPGSPDDEAANARSQGGSLDAEVSGDIAAGLAYLRAQTYSNNKIGVMGFCWGGRHAYLAAGQLTGIDAIVDCWGGGVGADPERITERQPVG